MKRKTLLLMLLMALISSGAWAQTEYHSYTNINHTYGSSSSLSTYNDDRYPSRLLDNNLDTKYCAVFINNTWPGWLSVTFESNDLIIPSKYVIYTGDDTKSNPGRNPKSWHIDAKVKESDSWTTIHTVTDANLPAENKKRVEYTISGVTTAYKYFRFYINSVESGSTFQLQDFHFLVGPSAPTWSGSSNYYISNFKVTKGSTILLENPTSGTANQNNDYYNTKTITASPGDELSCQITCNVNSNSTYGYAMWVDFDGNGLTSADKVFGTSSSTSSPYTGTLTIPANTPRGEYRVRILADNNTSAPSDPCGSYQNGESEDYKLNVVIAPASLPYTENFDNGQNGWEFANGGYTNHWTIGAATSVSSSNSLYVTNGTANEYSMGSSSYVYAYRELNFTAAGDYVVSFKWKANGESGCWDAMYAALVPQGTACPPSSNITGSSNALPNGYINASNASTAFLWGKSSWQTSTKNVSIPSAGVYTLVFYWKNDNSGGTNPPAAVDDIDIHADLPPITEIYTVADWEAFCTAVNSDHSYSGETVTLMNDITTAVTTMAGTIEGSTVGNAFKGTFDGQGHTITLGISGGSTTSTDWVFTAPFRCINGAKIKNLKVEGTVTQIGGKGAACVAGCTIGDNEITNCNVHATIASQTNTYQTDGDGTHGGFVSYIKSGSVTFNNCAFTGSITGETTRYCGGFVGWKAGSATFNNCVFAPTAITFDADHSGDNSANFSRNGGTFNNCYYTQTCGSVVQGKLMHSITGASGITVTNAGSATNYTPETSTIVGYGTGIKFNNILYACSGENVSLTLSGSAAGYVADHGTLVENGSNYTLTMEAYNTIITYKPLTKTIEAYGTSERGGYYLIASPLAAAIAPTNVNGMITDNVVATEVEANGTYDLYSFDQAETDEWQNYRTSNFNLVNGQGYLYASKESTTLTFSGAPYSGDGQVTLHKAAATGLDFPGWNLVGNPFALDDAYINKSFYTLENSDTYTSNTAGTAIHPMQGLFVVADEEGETLTFSTEAPAGKVASLNMNVSKVATRGVSAGTTNVIDQAIISFTEGQELPKLQFRNGSTKVYLPKDGKEYAIVSAKSMGTMPVNFKAEDNGTYTLDFTTKEVSFNYLHLIDNMNGNDVDLLQTPYYTFDAKSTDYASRFTLVFATGSSTGSETDNFAFFNNGNWIINNDGEATLQIVDVMGRILSSETISGSCSKAINVATGVYMLRLINGDKAKVQKIVVR